MKQFGKSVFGLIILILLFAGFTAVSAQGTEETFDTEFWDRGWEKYTIAGNPQGLYYNLGKKRLSFNLPVYETYAFLINPEITGEDVTVEATFENIRSASASYSVVCRFTEDGWYEFRTTVAGKEAGSYKVLKYDSYLKEQNKAPYTVLHPGMDRYNTYDINLGMNKKNTLKMICEGETIRIFINDKEQTPVKFAYLSDSDFSAGAVGFGAQSYGDGIVDIDVLKFSTTGTQVSEPGENGFLFPFIKNNK